MTLEYLESSGHQWSWPRVSYKDPRYRITGEETCNFCGLTYKEYSLSCKCSQTVKCKVGGAPAPARIPEEYPRPDIAQHLTARLGSLAGGTLSWHYADVVLEKGIKATPKDALDAWARWLANQGGWSDTPLEVSAYNVTVANEIREVARYERNTEVKLGS